MSTTPNLRVLPLLESGQPVKIVCFGDSITGVYYHTGGRRAWCDALGRALRALFPTGQIEMINAGISGNTTTHALARMETDVLGHQPNLIVVMLGMNDVVHNTPEVFRANLRQIVQHAHAQHAEVVLMTPNSISPQDPARVPARLADFAQIVREVAQEYQLLLADSHRVFEDIRINDTREWMRIMSDHVHPNMRGHQLFATIVAGIISGREVTPTDLPRLRPALPRLAHLLRQDALVRITAMKPYDEIIATAIRSLFPQARLDMTALDPSGKSLAELEQTAKEHGWFYYSENPDLPKPDLTVVAVPATTSEALDASYYRSYTWVLNWSQSFGANPRADCLPILPSVLQPTLPPTESAVELFALDIIRGIDLPFVQRAAGDDAPTTELMNRALRTLLQD